MNSHELSQTRPTKDSHSGGISRRDLSKALLFAPFVMRAAPNPSRARIKLDRDRVIVVHPNRPAKVLCTDGRVEEITS